MVVLVVLLGVALSLAARWANRDAVRSLSESVIRGATAQTRVSLTSFFSDVTKGLRMIEGWQREGLLDIGDPDALDAMLIPLLRSMPQIAAVLVADERGVEHLLVRTGTQWRRRQAGLAGEDGVRWLDWAEHAPERIESFEDLDYDPRTRPWYVEGIAHARAGGRGAVYWTAAYRFFTTDELGLTAVLAVPREGEPDLVFGFDVYLHELTELTSGQAMRVSKNSRVFIVDEKTQQVLGLPYDTRLPTRASRRALAGTPVSELDSPIVVDVLAGHRAEGVQGDGVFPFESGGERWWGGIESFELGPDRRLLIAVAMPESDALASATLQQLGIPLVALVVIALAIWRAIKLAGLISHPIEALVEESERIRLGDLGQSASIHVNLAEVQQLADAQDRMREGLRTLLKLEGDLQVARQIQQNTFPHKLPSLPGFDIAGFSDPADETGGDTYDVIGLNVAPEADLPEISEGDAQQAALLLADATGHGIGPALSVTQLRAMLRMLVRTTRDAESIARLLNDQLCADLPGSRFITVWLGLVDAAAGTLTSWSAGQGPLIHYHARRDEFEVRLPDAPPMGILSDLEIVIPEPLALERGDFYVVLSDGVYEAANPDDERFGEQAVHDLIRRHRAGSAAELVAAIRRDVDTFVRGRSAADDRTGVVVKRV